MDQENIDYLNAIAERVEFYFNVRKKTIKYIVNNQIGDRDLSVSLVLMGAVWAAHQRKEDITEDDLLILFGLTSSQSDGNKTVLRLDPAQTDLTLEEIFELTVENFK